MTVSFQTVRAALRGDFATDIATPLSLSTQYENAPFTKPAAGGSWAQFNILFADSELIEIAPVGSRTFRAVGVLLVNVFTELETGDKAATDFADSIASRYRGTTISGVLFRAPTVEQGVRDESGAWWRVTVRCPFEVLQLG